MIGPAHVIPDNWLSLLAILTCQRLTDDLLLSHRVIYIRVERLVRDIVGLDNTAARRRAAVLFKVLLCSLIHD